MQVQQQKHTFLDLPPELRNQIYEYMFVLDGPVEVWAETGDQDEDHKVHRRRGRAHRKLFKQVHNLRLLRTCKQILFEASPFFYRRNDFRFSGLNGHMVAYAWILKIGPRNWPYIESMTIGMPLRSYQRGCLGRNWNPSIWTWVHKIYDDMPFAFPASTKRFKCQRLHYETSWNALARKLVHLPRLKALTLVLPEDCTYTENHQYEALKRQLNQNALRGFKDILAAKPFFELHIVRMLDLDSDPTKILNDHAFVIKTLRSLAVCRVQFASFDIGGDWRLVPNKPFVDRRGCVVTQAHLDAVEDVMEILPDVGRIFGDD